MRKELKQSPLDEEEQKTVNGLGLVKHIVQGEVCSRTRETARLDHEGLCKDSLIARIFIGRQPRARQCRGRLEQHLWRPRS